MVCTEQRQTDCSAEVERLSWSEDGVKVVCVSAGVVWFPVVLPLLSCDVVASEAAVVAAAVGDGAVVSVVPFSVAPSPGDPDVVVASAVVDGDGDGGCVDVVVCGCGEVWSRSIPSTHPRTSGNQETAQTEKYSRCSYDADRKVQQVFI